MSDCVTDFRDVVEAVSSLKTSKADGYFGLSTIYFINGCDVLYVHNSMLFSSVLVHGTASDDLLISSIVLFLKVKTLITLSPLIIKGSPSALFLEKSFDRIILNKYADKLITPQLQFGFKKKKLFYTSISLHYDPKRNDNKLLYTANKGLNMVGCY